MINGGVEIKDLRQRALQKEHNGHNVSKIGTQHIRLFRRNLSTPLTAKTFLSFSSSAESPDEKRL